MNLLTRIGGALTLALVAALSGPAAPAGAAAERTIVVASTTSTQDSGLFEYLLPLFTARTGITVKVVAQGTGQALDTARRGDANVAFVHDREAEEKFVADGEGVRRVPVMYNDFVLIGPRADPAGVRGRADVTSALRAIRDAKAPFVSRGDRSGTHLAELRLWKAAGLTVEPARDAWYRAVGQGMGAALNIASASNAYLLVDRATWIRFGNKGDLRVLSEGDPRLFNPYSVILVNPAKHPHLDQATAQRFIDYLVSTEGQSAIAAFRLDGQPVFHPDAR